MAIKKELEKYRIEVLLPSIKYKIKYLRGNRKYVNKDGIYKADVVFVPLEDGDRCEALIKNGKKVITVDLNPLSRTAKNASVTIVDNIVRVIPLMIKRWNVVKRNTSKYFDYDNKKILDHAVREIK